MIAPPELDPAGLAMLREPPEPPLRLPLPLGDGLTEVHLEVVLRWLRGKRLTGRARLRGRTVALKVFFGRRARRHDRRLAAGAARVRAAGLATPPCLARVAAGGAIVLVHGWVDGTPVQDPAPAGAEAVGDLFVAHGRLHGTGCAHADPHLHNFLVPGDGGPLQVLDTDAVRPLGRLPGARQRALALQLAEFTAPSEAWIAELLGRYDAAVAATGAALAPLAPETGRIRRLTDRRRLRNARLLARKAARGGARFRRVLRPDGYAVHDLDLPARLRDAFEADPDGFFRDARWLKAGNAASVVRPAVALADGTGLVLKRYNVKRRSRLPFGPSRAERSWSAGHLLRGLGIPTPRAWALVQERRGAAPGRAWVLASEARGETLAERIDREPVAAWPEGLRHDLLRIFARCARYGVDHGDFKATNFVVAQEGLLLLDLDATVVRGPGPRAARAWRRDRDRFRRNFDRPEDLAWIDRFLAAPPAEP